MNARDLIPPFLRKNPKGDWFDKKMQAYGWRGFFNRLSFIGLMYVVLHNAQNILEFFNGKLTYSDYRSIYANTIVYDYILKFFFAMNVVGLINDYTQQGKARQAEKERKKAIEEHKNQLMEAEILERKQEALKKDARRKSSSS